MFISIKRGILCLTISFFAVSIVFSQSSDTDYRRFSLSVSGGASLGDMNRGDYFMSSNFSLNTEEAPTFGAGLQYALTPAWSLEIGYRHVQIKGKTVPFETSMNLFSFKNIISLNQVFFVNRYSTRINPFLSAGFGYDMFTYKGPEEEFSAHNSSYNAGAGIAYRVSNTVDLFTHYEYHVASNETDNEVAGYGADFINTLTGGLRINFGKKDSKHPSWRDVPVDISPSDYNLFMSQSNIISDLERRMDKIAQRQDEKENEYDQVLANKASEIDSLKARLDLLNTNTDDLRKALASYRKQINTVTVNAETGFAESLPGGHYVQVFASIHQDVAKDVRAHTMQALQNPGDQIFIIKRKQFYEVMIGTFNNFAQAQNVETLMKQIHNDAYVISFPRPMNLQTDFEGLKVIDEETLVKSLD